MLNLLLYYYPGIVFVFGFFFDSMLDVFYLDYGQSECVPLDRVCHPSPSDIMSRPVVARYITLDGVKPVSNLNYQSE